MNIGNTDVSNDDAMMFVLCCDHEAVWQQGQGASGAPLVEEYYYTLPEVGRLGICQN